MCSVLDATLLKDAIKVYKIAFTAQQVWVDAAILLAMCLVKAHKGDFPGVDMIQTAMILMWDASHNLRGKC